MGLKIPSRRKRRETARFEVPEPMCRFSPSVSGRTSTVQLQMSSQILVFQIVSTKCHPKQCTEVQCLNELREVVPGLYNVGALPEAAVRKYPIAQVYFALTAKRMPGNNALRVNAGFQRQDPC